MKLFKKLHPKRYNRFWKDAAHINVNQLQQIVNQGLKVKKETNLLRGLMTLGKIWKLRAKLYKDFIGDKIKMSSLLKNNLINRRLVNYQQLTVFCNNKIGNWKMIKLETEKCWLKKLKSGALGIGLMMWETWTRSRISIKT